MIKNINKKKTLKISLNTEGNTSLSPMDSHDNED